MILLGFVKIKESFFLSLFQAGGDHPEDSADVFDDKECATRGSSHLIEVVANDENRPPTECMLIFFIVM